MEFSILGCVLTLLMVVIPIYILEMNGANFLYKILRAMVKMVVFLGVLGALLYFVLKWNNIYLSILCTLLIMTFGSLMVTLKSRLSIRRYFLPVFIGIFSATVLVGLCLIFMVKDVALLTDAHVFIPVFAILVWAMIETNSAALRTFHVGLRHHGQLYEYLLGNGATHRQAIQYFMKRAYQRVSMPYIRRMAMVVIGCSPIIVWVLLLYGVDVWTVILFQGLVLMGTFCASVVSLYITLMVADRLSFDKYGVFKDQVKQEKNKEE